MRTSKNLISSSNFKRWVRFHSFTPTYKQNITSTHCSMTTNKRKFIGEAAKNEQIEREISLPQITAGYNVKRAQPPTILLCTEQYLGDRISPETLFHARNFTDFLRAETILPFSAQSAIHL